MVDWNDKQAVLLEIENNGDALEYALEELKNDKDIVLAAVKQHGDALRLASEELKNDKEVVIAAVKQNGLALMYASEELKNDKEIVITAVKQNGDALEDASEELKNDKEVMIAAVKQNGYALSYASEELKNDKEVVITAVKQNGLALMYASEELKNDKEVVVAAVEQNGGALEDASEELKDDKEVMVAAVKQDGYALYHASEELKNDKEVVITAVKQNGLALMYASEELKDDKEVMITAVEQNVNVLLLASEELKNDKEVMITAVKQNGGALKYASEELKNDKEVVIAAVKQNCMALKYAPEELKNDKALKHHASEELKYEKDAAVKYASTYSHNPKRWVSLENKTKITNKSDRDIEVVISHHEVEITFSAKGELGIDVCEVAKLGGSASKTTTCPPRKPEGTSILAGDTETFQLPQKDCYLTIMSSDPSKGFVVHEFNRRVLSKENWTFEQNDLKKVKLQSKAVFSNNSDRDMIVILSDCKVSTSAAATNIRQMGVNMSETEDYEAVATQIYVLLAHTTESFNVSEQSFFITTVSKDPELGHILHESNRSVASKDGFSFTQEYLKKNAGLPSSGKRKWF